MWQLQLLYWRHFGEFWRHTNVSWDPVWETLLQGVFYFSLIIKIKLFSALQRQRRAAAVPGACKPSTFIWRKCKQVSSRPRISLIWWKLQQIPSIPRTSAATRKSKPIPSTPKSNLPGSGLMWSPGPWLLQSKLQKVNLLFLHDTKCFWKIYIKIWYKNYLFNSTGFSW